MESELIVDKMACTVLLVGMRPDGKRADCGQNGLQQGYFRGDELIANGADHSMMILIWDNHIGNGWALRARFEGCEGWVGDKSRRSR